MSLGRRPWDETRLSTYRLLTSFLVLHQELTINSAPYSNTVTFNWWFRRDARRQQKRSPRVKKKKEGQTKDATGEQRLFQSLNKDDTTAIGPQDSELDNGQSKRWRSTHTAASPSENATPNSAQYLMYQTKKKGNQDCCTQRKEATQSKDRRGRDAHM